MNKARKFILAAMLVIASQTEAKEYHVVIKGSININSGPKTEIFVGKEKSIDTLTVIPGNNVTELQLCIKSLDGEVLFTETLPVAIPETFNFIIPPLNDNFMLEIKDNNGVVYTEIDGDD